MKLTGENGEELNRTHAKIYGWCSTIIASALAFWGLWEFYKFLWDKFGFLIFDEFGFVVMIIFGLIFPIIVIGGVLVLFVITIVHIKEDIEKEAESDKND